LWLKNEIGIKTKKLPYYPGHGGILLKDAAVMAGLGCLGKNNMLIMPDYGPRVRLRALLADVLLPGTGPIDFDPCRDCDTPCRSVCPQKAFDLTIYSEKELGTRQLPARSGAFSWPLCRRQMEIDRSQAEHIKVEGEAGRRKAVENCRLCEYSCPVGQ
jgi:epoxyqueuosine reductase